MSRFIFKRGLNENMPYEIYVFYLIIANIYAIRRVYAHYTIFLHLFPANSGKLLH